MCLTKEIRNVSNLSDTLDSAYTDINELTSSKIIDLKTYSSDYLAVQDQ